MKILATPLAVTRSVIEKYWLITLSLFFPVYPHKTFMVVYDKSSDLDAEVNCICMYSKHY